MIPKQTNKQQQQQNKQINKYMDLKSLHTPVKMEGFCDAKINK